MTDQEPRITVKVVPEIDHKAVMEAMAQVQRDLRAAVQALAPVMQQLGAAFVEFGNAGYALADRLREVSKQQTDEQRRHLDAPEAAADGGHGEPGDGGCCDPQDGGRGAHGEADPPA